MNISQLKDLTIGASIPILICLALYFGTPYLVWVGTGDSMEPALEPCTLIVDRTVDSIGQTDLEGEKVSVIAERNGTTYRMHHRVVADTEYELTENTDEPHELNGETKYTRYIADTEIQSRHFSNSDRPDEGESILILKGDNNQDYDDVLVTDEDSVSVGVAYIDLPDVACIHR